MANLIAIVGKSGTGKSTSLLPNKAIGIEGLVPEETIILNVSGKPLPAKGSNTMFPYGDKISEGARNIHTQSMTEIRKIINTIDTNEKFKYVKNIVIDDAQYLQVFMFMDNIKEVGYDKYNDAGNASYVPLKAALSASRSDLNIIFTFHQEKEDGEYKIKTVGKIVDNYITIEGLFTIVLYTAVSFDPVKKASTYQFITQNTGSNTGKSPYGMFENLLIPNDMGYVLKKVKEYYE